MALNQGPGGSGHGSPSSSSSRQRLKQRFACTSGMLVVHEEAELQASVVHSTASATRNFFSSLSQGLRPLVGGQRQRSWLVRDTSLPSYLDRLDTGSSNASPSAFSGSVVGAFGGSTFRSALDLPGLFAVEDTLSNTVTQQVALENQQAVVQQQQQSQSEALAGQTSSASGPAASGSTEEEAEEPFMVLERSLDPRSSGNGFPWIRDDVHNISGVAQEEAQDDTNVRNETSSETEIWQHQKAIISAAETEIWQHQNSVISAADTEIQQHQKAVISAADTEIRQHQKAVVSAAISIQAMYRSFSVRAAFRSKLAAAVKIQCFCRGWLARRNQRVCIAHVVKLQACARRNRACKQYRQLREIVLLLQRKWRFIRRRKLQLQSKAEEDSAAVRIQSAVRGWVSRKNFKKEWWWGHRQQQLYKLELDLRHQSAQRIQVRWRGFWSLQVLRVEKWVRERAATRLQAVIRGHQVRQGIIWQQQNAAESVLQQHQRALRAAITIQSVFRAFLCRRDYLCLRRKVLLVQETWRASRQKSRLLSALLKAKAVDATRIVEHPEAEEASAIAIAEERRFAEPKQLEHGEEKSWISTSDPDLHMKSSQISTSDPDLHMESSRISTSDPNLHMESSRISTSETDLHMKSSWISTSDPDLHMESSRISTSDPDLHMESLEAAVDPRTADAGSREPEQPTFSTPRPGSSSSVEDWNNLQVDELDECLDTFLAALPLASHSRRQSTCLLDIDPTPSAAALCVGTTTVSEERAENVGTPEIACANSSEMYEERRWQDVPHVSANDRGSSHASYSQGSVVGDQGSPEPVKGEGYVKPLKSLNQDEERLQQFAQVFLTMRQISNQQQRAQSAPPFPPSSSSSSSPVRLSPEEDSSVSSPQPGEVNPTAATTSPGVSTVQNGPHVSLEIRDLDQTPRNREERGGLALQAYDTGNSANAQDVVLDMVELLKMMEQYYDREAVVDAATADAKSCSKSVFSGGDDVEGGGGSRAWNLQKNGYTRTSTAALGIKHFRLPDVNVVLIVLVAMVVYTRTVCRDIFSRTRQLHRKP